MYHRRQDASPRSSLLVPCAIFVVLTAAQHCHAEVVASISDKGMQPPHFVSMWQKQPLIRQRPDDASHLRAGCPQCVAGYARPSVNKHYLGYYVGGGAAIRGEGRCLDEGVWGVDYRGGVWHRIIRLDWWHGTKNQGGTGAYKTDGPHLLKQLHEHE